MGGCDESKCVSKGRSDLYDDSFTCYGDDGTFYPMMCADGYLPLVINDEGYSISNFSEGVDVAVEYFTCCPPQHHLFSNISDSDVARRCSDPITALEADWDSGEIVDTICEDDWDNRTDAFRIKPSSRGERSSFLCCDSFSTDEYNGEDVAMYEGSIENNSTILPEEDYLEDLECVPYRNEFYQASNAHNQIGATNAQNQIAMLRPIVCDTPEHDFMVPRPFGNGTIDDVASTGRYQCCRDGPSLPPFIPDSSFRITLYPAFCLFCVAAVLSAIAVVGLLVPFLIQLSNGSFRKETTGTRQGEPRYNTYNLYSVYLMAIDLIYCLFQIPLYGRTIQQKFHPGFHGFFIPPTTQDSLMLDPLLEQPYYFVTLWFNCIICYQILLLLRSSRSGHTIEQPSLRRVNLQVGVTCLFGMIIGSSCYFIEDAIQTAEVNSDTGTQQILLTVFLVFGTVLGLPPILYMLNASCIIWWGGYIPSLSIGRASDSDRSTRELVFYFFRIIVVFLVVILPVMGLILYASIKEEIWVYTVTSCLVAIQPTLKFCMILTLPDARNYILKLLTLSYLFGDNSCERNRRKEDGTLQIKTKTGPQNRSKISTRTSSIQYGDSNRDSTFINNGGSKGNHFKADTEACASPKSSGRYIYASRRIPGMPATILPTGEMISMAVIPEIRSTATIRTNAGFSDEEEFVAIAESPGMRSIETARMSAESSDDERNID